MTSRVHRVPRTCRTGIWTAWVRGLIIWSVVLVLGCASEPRLDEVPEITANELLAGSPLGVQSDPPGLVDDDEVLAVSADMREFATANVSLNVRDSTKLRQLIHAIVDPQVLGLEYDEATRTASETFRLRRGNCLSFSNMLVALARYVGMEVHFQEVDVPPDWTMENDAFVLVRHISVTVDLGLAGEHFVDLNIGDFRSANDRTTISDRRALAHTFNNLGVERMQAGDTASAFSYFRKAIAENDRTFAPAWTNLGMLYLRSGHPAFAEAAYLMALQADPDDFVAMSNLVGLYQQRGEAKRAEVLHDRVARHRMQNPYYRYQLAREALSRGEYDRAIGHLKYAIRRNRDEDQFYLLLGESYLQKGEERTAKRWLTRAEQVAATGSLRPTASNTIEIVLPASK